MSLSKFMENGKIMGKGAKIATVNLKMDNYNSGKLKGQNCTL